MTSLDRYTCEEAFRRMGDYLDRELQPVETTLVREHLEVCEVCAREFRFEASVLTHVKLTLRRVHLPTDLRARILGALERAASDA
jgi:anti-sigma factor (TIGR02949 family)